MFNKPNFFIIGAPKCGTTSLAAWLSEHENIYMSPIKEPFYFADDLKQREKINGISTEKNYNLLFNKVEKTHSAVGEASTSYLFSDTAIDNILEYCDEIPKIIVMLRNPVEMAESLHFQQIYSLNESEKDFEKAWELQESRKHGQNIPSTCIDDRVLFYKDWCLLGEQVNKLSSKIDLTKVHFIFIEDLKKNPLEVYKNALNYLNVPYDHRVDFTKKNESKTFKYRWVRYVMRLGVKLKRSIGIYKSFNLERFINNKAEIRKKPTKLFKKRLISEFSSDIDLLATLTKKELEEWKRL